MLRKIFIVTGDVVVLMLLLFIVLHFSLVVYGLKMGKGQLTLIWRAREVNEVLQDAAVPDSIKTKLRLIGDIRDFAFTHIGLKRSDSYTQFYDQKGQPLMYVVTACEKFRLEPYQWDYSFLGKMPYKGFFNQQLAEKEKKRLKALGYDVAVSGAAGWSTLGWFPDPILSQMLRYNEGELAELIIHELFHSTIFIQDSIELNENLADFVGMKGAKAFLSARYGIDSPELANYKKEKLQENAKEKFLIHTAQQLDRLYRTFPLQHTSTDKLRERNAFYSTVIHAASNPSIGDSLYAKRLQKKLTNTGNTLFVEALRYNSKQDMFERDYAKYADIMKYMSALKKKYSHTM